MARGDRLPVGERPRQLASRHRVARRPMVRGSARSRRCVGRRRRRSPLVGRRHGGRRHRQPVWARAALVPRRVARQAGHPSPHQRVAGVELRVDVDAPLSPSDRRGDLREPPSAPAPGRSWRGVRRVGTAECPQHPGRGSRVDPAAGCRATAARGSASRSAVVGDPPRDRSPCRDGRRARDDDPVDSSETHYSLFPPFSDSARSTISRI